MTCNSSQVGIMLALGMAAFYFFCMFASTLADKRNLRAIYRRHARRRKKLRKLAVAGLDQS